MDQQQRPVKRARRTHARRSCLACRQRKARCELPDITVPSSMEPLERHLQCHRCRTLETDCIVWDGDRKVSANKSLRYGPPQEKQTSSSSPAPSASKPSPLDRRDCDRELATTSEVVDTFSLWATMPRDGQEAPASGDAEGPASHTGGGRNGHSASGSDGKRKTSEYPTGHVNPHYRSKLAMAYDRNTAQVTEIIYRSPHYAERAAITEKMIASRAPPPRIDTMTPLEQSRMRSLILAYPFLDPKLAGPVPPNVTVAPPEEWLRNVTAYICSRPKHTDELLASILGTSVYHSLMQTRSLNVCQGLLLLAIHEPIDLIFRKPSTELEEIIDRAPGHSIFAAAFGIALSFRLDEAIPNMRSGPTALTPDTPKEERQTRLREAALWLALHNFAVALCEPGIKPRLPSPSPSQLDIETFESNIRPLLVNAESSPRPRTNFADLQAAALLAHAYSAKYHRRLRTYWNETELLTVQSPDYVPSTRHFCLSLKKDGEALLEEQAKDFAILPKDPALEVLTTLTQLRMANSIGRITAALLFTFGAHVAQKHGAFITSNILKGISEEPRSSTFCLREINDLSEQTFRETLKLARAISQHEPDLLNILPPISFSTAVFSATKHLIEKQVFLSSNPSTRSRARPQSILAAVREGLAALERVARGQRTSVPFIIYEVLSELTKRFAVAVDVLTWVGSTREADDGSEDDESDVRQPRPREEIQSHASAPAGSQGTYGKRNSPLRTHIDAPIVAGTAIRSQEAVPPSTRQPLGFEDVLNASYPVHPPALDPVFDYSHTQANTQYQPAALSSTALPHHSNGNGARMQHSSQVPMFDVGYSGGEPQFAMPAPLFGGHASGADAASLSGLIRNDMGGVLDLTSLFDWASPINDPSGNGQSRNAGSGFQW